MTDDLIKDLRFWNGGIDSDKKMQKAADRIEQLEAALRFYHCGCAEGTCVVNRPKFKGIRCGYTARKALDGVSASKEHI